MKKNKPTVLIGLLFLAHAVCAGFKDELNHIPVSTDWLLGNTKNSFEERFITQLRNHHPKISRSEGEAMSIPGGSYAQNDHDARKSDKKKKSDSAKQKASSERQKIYGVLQEISAVLDKEGFNLSHKTLSPHLQRFRELVEPYLVSGKLNDDPELTDLVISCMGRMAVVAQMKLAGTDQKQDPDLDAFLKEKCNIRMIFSGFDTREPMRGKVEAIRVDEDEDE